MKCLVRFLPLMIGDKVEKNNKYWNILRLLNQIIELVISSHLSEDLIVKLDLLIQEHHSAVKELFPEFRLKKKHHNMIHYANSFRKLGNLIDFSTIRFEAKHTFSKTSANTINNSKNILFSIAKSTRFICVAIFQII